MRRLLPKKQRNVLVPLPLTEEDVIKTWQSVAEALRESSSSSSSGPGDEAASDPETVMSPVEEMSAGEPLAKCRKAEESSEPVGGDAAKKLKLMDAAEPVVKSRRTADGGDASPSKLYPPSFAAGIQSVLVHGDGPLFPDSYDADADSALDALVDEEFLEEVADEAPVLEPEELERVDAAADQTEISRLVSMGVLVKATDEQVTSGDFKRLTTKLVRDWRKRPGWVRRSRLVGREYRFADPHMEGTFAPTTSACTLRLAIILAAIFGKRINVIDIKDAYLLVDQVEPVLVDLRSTGGEFAGWYELKKMLPGQRTGAAGWYNFANQLLNEFGLSAFPKQPTLYSKKVKRGKEWEWLILDLHADDGVVVGDDSISEEFFEFLGTKVKFSRDGPHGVGGEFNFLKKKYQILEGGIICRPDPIHIKKLVELVLSGRWRCERCRARRELQTWTTAVCLMRHRRRSTDKLWEGFRT